MGLARECHKLQDFVAGEVTAREVKEVGEGILFEISEYLFGLLEIVLLLVSFKDYWLHQRSLFQFLAGNCLQALAAFEVLGDVAFRGGGNYSYRPPLIPLRELLLYLFGTLHRAKLL